MIVRLILSEYKREQEEAIYRIYLTDSLKVLTENSAKHAGGSMIRMRYHDIINKHETGADKRSGDEIASEIISRAGLELA